MVALFGRYEYARELGRGAQGRVFAVRDLSEGGAERAIKVVSAHEQGRLRWEFARLCSVEHAYVARVRELLRVPSAVHAPFGLPADSLLLVEDLAPGVPLSQVPDPGDARARARFLLQVALRAAEALAAVHGAGLVHGDVKPDNLLVDASSLQVTLVDLGFAGVPAPREQASGTPRYMAPELLAGVFSTANDVYALGALMFDWLLGASAPSSAQHGGGGLYVRDTALLQAQVNAPLQQLIELLLQPDLARRPADGWAAWQAIGPVAAQLGVVGTGQRELLHGAPTAQARAARARTLPYVAREPLLARVEAAIAQGGVVLVRGASGAGRSRTVREALRRHQLRCAEGRRSLPTVVRSFEALEQLRDVSAVLWLQPDEDDLTACVTRAQRMSLLAERPLSVLVECGPLAEAKDAECITVGPLADDELAALLRALLAPQQPSQALQRAAAEASQSMAGRLCELCAGLLSQGRDPLDPRSYLAQPHVDGMALSLSQPASRLAGAFAWWDGALTPELSEALLPEASLRDAAFRELWARGLLVQDGQALRLSSALARSLRARFASERLALVTPLAQRSEARGGFARLALDQRAQAAAAFLHDARKLRASGAVDAANELLREVCGWLDHAELRWLWADTLRARADYDLAAQLLEQEPSPEAQLLRADVLRLRGQAQAALQVAERVRSAGAPPFVSRAQGIMARLQFDAGDFAGARTLAEQACASGDDESRLRGLELQLLLQLAGSAQEPELTDTLVAAARDADAPRALARALSLRAQLLARSGARAAALRDAQQALAGARALGELHETATFALNLGLLHGEAGELGLALQSLREAAYQLSRIDRPRDMARVLFNLASVALLVGDDARAGALLSAVQGSTEPPDAQTGAYLAAARAELLTRQGQLEAAQAILLSAYGEAPASLPLARALLAARAAQLLVLRGQLDVAEELLQEAQRAVGADATLLPEVAVASVRLALARADRETAERVAQAALSELAGRAPFAETLRLLLAAVDAARACDDQAKLAERTALARALLEGALAGLPPPLRARMRERPEVGRVLGAGVQALPGSGESSARDRWRALVGLTRRLFASPHPQRIAQQVVDSALELVHAERALLIACTDQGALEVRARAELSGDAGRSPPFSRSVVERVWAEQRSLMTLDAAQDVRLQAAQSIHALSVRSVLAVYVAGFAEPCVLYLDDRVRAAAFQAEDLALLEDLAALTREACRAGRARNEERRRARKAEAAVGELTREVEQAAVTGKVAPSTPLVGNSRALLTVIDQAKRVAPSDVSVLLTGESGTGKELLARWIHDHSARRARPFVAESCAALPDALLESALFGHVRGAFTGAEKARRGLFEIADQGTLFLDEVGEMSPALQAKLLRVLQEGVFRPLGSEREKRVDVRVVAATRRDLVAAVRSGAFREDLYYRLAVLTLELPPLARRREDIPLLVRHFVDKHQPAGRTVRVSSAALRALTLRDYAGNVRQLENEVRRALVLCRGELIEPEDLSESAPETVPVRGPSALDLHQRLDGLTRALVEEAMAQASGNVTQAAQLLGLSRFGLQKMLKRYKPSAQRK